MAIPALSRRAKAQVATQWFAGVPVATIATQLGMSLTDTKAALLDLLRHGLLPRRPGDLAELGAE